MSPTALDERIDPFEHLAMFYDGLPGFMRAVVPFIAGGLESRDIVLVAVGPEKIEALKDHFGVQEDLTYADIREVGRNPARIIPLWIAFTKENATRGRGFRGVGEPIWRERTLDELVECELHEALLNVAFERTASWTLACPYDVASLDDAVLAEARRNHPWLSEGGSTEQSRSYRGSAEISLPSTVPLDDPPGEPQTLAFAVEDLAAVRRRVEVFARDCGLDDDRVGDLVLAADEVAANSVRYGGGAGEMRCWFDGTSVFCEVRDHGTFDEIMAGRRMPSADASSGYGLWLVNQVCDLVQIRALETGSVVRLQVRAVP